MAPPTKTRPENLDSEGRKTGHAAEDTEASAGAGAGAGASAGSV